jgi:hypothetical protein
MRPLSAVPTRNDAILLLKCPVFLCKKQDTGMSLFKGIPTFTLRDLPIDRIIIVAYIELL